MLMYPTKNVVVAIEERTKYENNSISAIHDFMNGIDLFKSQNIGNWENLRKSYFSL